MEESPLVVVKLGGALITEKRKPLTLRRDKLEAAAEAVSNVDEDYRLVIVHGGGSFGHYAVIEAGESKQKFITDVSYWMSVLNIEVVSALRRKGVSAVGVPPLTIMQYCQQGYVVNAEMVSNFLKAKVTPVTHGGLVLGREGFQVMSGDTIASELAIQLSASTLVFVMDVNSVYTADPFKDPTATPIRTLSREQLEGVKGGSSGLDVTGGISLKLREAFRAAEAGVRVALGGLDEFQLMVRGVEGSYTRVVPSNTSYETG
ncbi:MAG: isopentenyl phosphate kinase [Thermofilaceae archaeon]|nr:isopentenyl phosphate kinase [Thermofilaceae archaeon]MDW8004810.1 isopentenyl phosphate kinase [Thermofilaceae archaeon]